MVSSPQTSPVVYRAPSPGLLGRVLTPMFKRVKIDDSVAEHIARLREQGDLVFTQRSKRVIDPLYVLHALGKLGVEAPAWLHDHPCARGDGSAQSLVGTLAAGKSALLFLRRPRTLTSRQKYSEAHVEALIAAQRERERPILLVPTALLWRKKPVGLERTLFDAVFGDREDPGASRELMGFVWRSKDSKFYLGQPVNLQDVIAANPGLSDKVIAKKVRWTILHHLAREEELRTGPVHRPASRTWQAVKNDPQVKSAVDMLANQGKSPEQLEKRVDSILAAVAADMRYGWLRFLDAIIDFIWHRIYDGFQVDEAGLDVVRRAARKGPVVVVPSHKSHVDYLVLSQVFFKNDLIPPHIAAGENLNFWPMGTIFRRCGAFFIKRSFRGDKLYATVFGAYVRRLLKEGHAIEFFIEGGRSRTGKLLSPKLGMLSMVSEPVLEGRIPDVSFIPVSIGYEKVIEAGSYAKELAGGEKRKEDVTALVSSAKVLVARYGRVYVDFDEPISLREFAAERDISLPIEDTRPAQRKQTVLQLGHRILYGINRVTRATPIAVAALVLLASRRKGMAEEELFAKARRTLEQLRDLGARLSSTLESDSIDDPLRKALDRFVRDRLLKVVTTPDGETNVYRLEEKSRVALDYYKNNILHFFIPTAVVAAAALAAEDEASGTSDGGKPAPLELANVRVWALRISQLLKHEVTFRVGTSFDENFDEAIAQLQSWGLLDVDTDTVEIGDRPDLCDQAGLLAVFFEAYRLVGVAFADLEGEGEVKEKQLLERALQTARRQALDGRLERAEAGSQPVLRTGLSVHLAEKGLERGEGGLIIGGEAEARRQLTSSLERLCRIGRY